MTHTPGPWATYDADQMGTYTVIGQDGEFVAWTRDMHKPDAECEANARLIAKAPEMLAQLEQVVSVFGSLARMNVGRPTIDAVRALLAEVVAP